jgi:energy-coupling factor transport system ATP-binding protein
MIKLQNLSFQFNRQLEPVLKRINLEFQNGEFALICGPTGSGKSTLLKTINGLAPHFTGGSLAGKIIINGVETTAWAPHQLAALVGYVNQQPEGAFVAETVDQEIAYSLEQLGKPQNFMHSTVLELARLLKIDSLLKRNLNTLSGGQQQRVAIAAALAAGAQTLLLDEPTSALDISSTIDIVETLKDLTKTQNLTVLLAEHRIEKLLEIADTLTVVHGDATATQGPLRGENLDLLFSNHRMVPTVVELSTYFGCNPTAVTLEDAKAQWLKNPPSELGTANDRASVQTKTPAFKLTDFSVDYQTSALKNCTLEIDSSEITAIMGPNGSGKTTLLWALVGELEKSAKLSGTIEPNLGNVRPNDRLKTIALVPQRASDLLFLNTLSEELAESDRFSNLQPGSTAKVLEKISGRLDPNQHPRDLSAGQQLALVIAIQLAKNASILLLDEPTRGLDYVAKRALAGQLIELKAAQKTIILASHDTEFVAQVADRVVVLANSKITRDGAANRILAEPGLTQSTTAAVTAATCENPPINLAQIERRFKGKRFSDIETVRT